jgi:4-hydroxy-tetrahydrodipicolinate synthase
MSPAPARRFPGVIPPIVTPFTKDGAIDEAGLRSVVRFTLGKGVHGVCFGGSTGEGHTFSTADFVRVAEVVCEEVAGRVPVLAGVITNSTMAAIERAKAIAHLDIAALQITPVHYLFKPDDDATFAHFEAITREIATPLVIYNVVPWNYLSPALLVRIMSALPGVIGVKQSAGDLKLMADLLLAAPADRTIYTAVDALLYPSFALGAHGVIAANPAAVPGVCVALWNAVQRGDHARAREIHEALLRFWNTIVGDNLPANVKYALARQGCQTGLPRMPMPVSAPDRLKLVDAALADALRYEEPRAEARAA